ncbi:MAG: PolC-type DNA polymerase III [Clostridia bacterium]|nr:PolC-type DNA polymerase III [Clostridia bacterium]
MKSIINKHIDWNKLAKLDDEGKATVDIGKFKFKIENTRLYEEDKILEFDISSNFVLPYFDMKMVKKDIMSNLPELKYVRFNYRFENMLMAEEDAIKLFVPHMINFVNREYAALTKSINYENIDFAGDRVLICAFGDFVINELNAKVANRFAEYLNQYLGIKREFQFVNDPDNDLSICERIQREYDEKKLQIMEEMKANQEEASSSNRSSGATQASNNGDAKKWRGQKRKVKEAPAEGNRLLGKELSDDMKDKALTEYTGINEESGTITIKGEVYRYEFRVLKTGNTMATLLVSNEYDTICCKSFLSEEKARELAGIFEKGQNVLVRGEAEFDRFENMICIKMSDVNLIEANKGREETYEGEERRVELHCHSIMSQMDGLNEPKRIVELACQWGQKAVAITDHGVVQSFPDMAAAAKGKDIKIIYGLEGYVIDDEGFVDEDGNIDYKSPRSHHIIILAKTQEGLKNIYKLVSKSHLEYFYRKPRIPWSLLEEHREGLIIGSACEAGELYRAIVNKESEERIKKIASRYDYFEIQPLVNNRFMVERNIVNSEEDLKAINKRIYALGQEMGKLVLATTDAHYEGPEAAKYRNIILAGQGYQDAESGQGLYLRTTAEMLQEFSYFGEEIARELVITNTNKIADMVDGNILPVPKGKYPPKIENSEKILRESCEKRAKDIYGDPLPEEIGSRLEKELSSIIDNGYSVMYVSAQMLVNKSLSDGYLVGSRGSVGSSFAATMAGITEVNPLPPHYICPKCKHLEWGDQNLYDCGCDMPSKVCPDCGTEMNRDGFTIPFETFLGFTGNKEPDIDLNFAGEYQATAHKYVGEIFGEKNVFKAGTVGTVAEKTAFGFVKKFYEEQGIPINKYETEREAEICTGVKRTTGQHPGGIVIVPDDHEIYEFCPVQRPANDAKSDIITTHFDYHKIDENLLKLDILGHDGPSMIRQLQDMTGVNPFDIPFQDEETKKVFLGTESLNIVRDDYEATHGSFGIPEFGTRFTRQMLDDTQPSKIGDLVRLSGFSHGTDVWLNNAQDYIKSKTATMNEVISTRDDIMNYLILKGLEKADAFEIMEQVRKGKVAAGKYGKWDDMKMKMKDCNVPDWYIDSCAKIKYMFPRAHAVAYVMNSWRMAWFKVHYPKEFYATYFSTKVSQFDYTTCIGGFDSIKAKIRLIDRKGLDATKLEQDQRTVLEVALEMYARGYEFAPVNLEHSKAIKFDLTEDGKVLPSFSALEGIGDTAAQTLEDAYKEKPFETIEDIKKRTKLNGANIEALKACGAIVDLPETDQFTLF